MNANHPVLLDFLIPQALPDVADSGEPIPIGYWDPEVLAEAKERGALPVILMMWPGDYQRALGAIAAKAAVEVANQNAKADPFLTAIIEGVASIMRQSQPSRPEEPNGPLLMKVSDYARRTGYSTAFIDRLIAKGLPTLGRHKARRVHVERADRWLEANLDHLDVPATEDLDDLAKANARKPKRVVK